MGLSWSKLLHMMRILFMVVFTDTDDIPSTLATFIKTFIILTSLLGSAFSVPAYIVLVGRLLCTVSPDATHVVVNEGHAVRQLSLQDFHEHAYDSIQQHDCEQE